MSTERFFSQPPTQAPKTMLFRDETISANTEYAEHSHNWSQVICIKSGVMSMTVAGQRYLTPCELAIWIPAGIKHSSHNRKSTRFCALDISPELSQGLPVEPCILTQEYRRIRPEGYSARSIAHRVSSRNSAAVSARRR